MPIEKIKIEVTRRARMETTLGKSLAIFNGLQPPRADDPYTNEIWPSIRIALACVPNFTGLCDIWCYINCLNCAISGDNLHNSDIFDQNYDKFTIIWLYLSITLCALPKTVYRFA